ncbi:MAG TPA: FHA domain-containing protein [Chloroflexota bacterium]
MSFAVVVLLFRLILVALLYLFLAQVVRIMYRDLRAAASSPATPALGGPGQPGAIAQLVVLSAGKTTFQAGQQFRLRNPTLLGREPASDILVDDDFVSGQHLRIVSGPTGWAAQDLNATNGTHLNGTRLRGTMPLKSGDILDVGRLKLRFVLDH